jgi:hypothetical protein
VGEVRFDEERAPEEARNQRCHDWPSKPIAPATPPRHDIRQSGYIIRKKKYMCI